jgi:hypothetical protein
MNGRFDKPAGGTGAGDASGYEGIDWLSERSGSTAFLNLK